MPKHLFHFTNAQIFVSIFSFDGPIRTEDLKLNFEQNGTKFWVGKD